MRHFLLWQQQQQHNKAVDAIVASVTHARQQWLDHVTHCLSRRLHHDVYRRNKRSSSLPVLHKEEGLLSKNAKKKQLVTPIYRLSNHLTKIFRFLYTSKCHFLTFVLFLFEPFVRFLDLVVSLFCFEAGPSPDF